MSIDVHDIHEKGTWEASTLSLRPNTFLQSWNAAEMNRMLGERVVTIGAFDDGALVGVAQAATVTARRGTFLFCAHGPLVRPNIPAEKAVHAALLRELAKRARALGMRFLRVSPLVPPATEWHALYTKKGFRDAPIHMHAETMWALDIRRSEDELLAGMRKTTRNLVRRGQREGVTVRMSTEPKDLALFERVYGETAQRERFVPFTHQYLDAEFRAFAADGRALLFFAEYHGAVLATALIPLFGSTGFYHQGASSRANAKVPAAYTLQWEIIRELKRRGLTTYNFWGIGDGPHHPWSGLTLFKQGFGGERIDYLHAQDFPLHPSYWLTYGIERFRRWRRGL